jgi:hypothetical protein
VDFFYAFEKYGERFQSGGFDETQIPNGWI